MDNRVLVEPNWALIDVLTNNLGMNVVYIDNRYFVYQEFIPAEEENVPIHRVIGRDITNQMNKYTAIASSDRHSVNEIISYVDSRPLITIEYSPVYLWIRYLAS